MELGDRKHQAGWTGYMNADVRYDKRLNSTAKVIMVEISALTNMKGYAWCTNQYLADAFGLSKSQVSRIIRQLAECGYINVYLNPGGERYITITSNDRPVPSGFKKDYTKKPESDNEEQDDKLLEEATTVEELLPEEKETVDTSETEMRELTTAEQCALQTKNIEADNYDRRGDVVDEDLYHKLKLEVIAESDARKAEEEAEKQQNIQAQQLPASTSAQTSAVATVQQNVPASVADSPLATPRTSDRKGYDPVLKAFYDAAKALGISIKNNATAQKHVKRLEDVRGDDWCIKYFDFLRINYRSWEYQYKPEIGNELDMIHKAKAIENGMRRMREEQQRKYKVY